MYTQLQQVETELCRYRKGSLSVRIDMVRGLIQWRDSNHWINDFTRSLNAADLLRIRESLADMDILCWQVQEDSAENENRCKYSWSVMIKTGDDRMTRGGVDQFPPKWNDFRTLIETISRTTFNL